MEWLKDRNGKMVIVEPSGSTRTMMAEVIRSLGFTDVSGVSTIKDAVGLLEVDDVDWILASVCPDQPENGMSLLKLACQRQELKSLRVSLLIDDAERDLLPDAFELGLLSFHPKKSTKDSLTAEINAFLTTAENCQWDATLISAVFLRKHLMSVGRFDELINFERRLIKQYPGDIEILFNLVPPLVRLEMKDQAKSTLRQILLLSPESQSRVDQMTQDYLNGENLRTRENEGVNALDLNHIVIVDSDDSARKVLEDLMKEIGVEHIYVFDNGLDAIEHINGAESIDLIFMEWRIPKLTGPLLIQRILGSQLSSTPMIICSSLVEKSDQPFIREMGVSHLLDKPIDRKQVMKIVLWTVQQQLAPTDQAVLERKIRQAIKERNLDALTDLRKKYMSIKQIGQGAKELIEAEIYFSKAQYVNARDHALASIRHNGDSLIILNLLGKILMNLQEFESALKCFEKAQQMAPQNLERLCRIAEVQSELGEEEKAKQTLEKAERLDSGSQVLAETNAKVALNQGDIEGAKAIMGQLEAMENVVSYLNNQAVALAKCDMLDKSIEQYEKAVLAIPDDRDDIKAIVYYNMALAHLRGSDTEAAQDALKSSVAIAGSRVEKKAKLLLKKVTKAIEMDIDLTLASTTVNLDQAKDDQVETENAPASSENKQSESEKFSDDSKDHLEASQDEDAQLENTENESDGNEDSALPKITAIESRQIKTDASLTHKMGLLDSMLQTRPGDICCYLIYQSNSHSEYALKLLERAIRFKKRDALEREASHGADRVMAGAS